MNTPPQKPQRLPNLRPGLNYVFSDYDREGKPQWLIQDHGRNKFFIVGWVEYEFLKRWELGTPDAVINAINTETTLHVDEHDLENLLAFLSRNYLIEQSHYKILKNAKEQKLFKKDNIFHWLVTYYLFFKIPLLHPDKFLIKTKIIGQWVFSRAMIYIMAILAIIALYQLNLQWDKFTHSFSTIFTWQGLFFYFIAYMICKFFHELGHAYMCRHYGVPVPTLGLAFLVFWPVLYTDTTLSWTLNYRKRLKIAFAGIWVETYVTIIAALIWCNTQNVTIQTITYLTITVNWIASLLINVSPFMRFDGYYVLADYLKMPNLQPRAFALTRWQIRRWLFKWPDPPPEKFSHSMHHFLIFYSITTWLYRLFIYLGIAILVYHFFIKIIGILLFAIEIYYFMLGPIINEIQVWIFSKEKFSLNTRTQITIFVAILLALLFFVPISESIKLPGTLSYDHEFLISPMEGILQNQPPSPGASIKANQPILELKSESLDYEIEKIRLGYNKKLNELRRAAINAKYGQLYSVILSDMNKQQAEYKKLMAQRAKLTLSVSFDGILVDIAKELKPGSIIAKDEWLADVINPSIIEGEAFVSQIDINDLKVNLKGYFYPDNISEPTVPVQVKSIEVLNSTKLHCRYSSEIKQDTKSNMVVETPCYNATDLGGKIASYYTETGEYEPIDSVFRVLLKTQKSVKLKHIQHIQRGTFVIETQANSYASWFFYKLKTIWIKQSGF